MRTRLPGSRIARHAAMLAGILAGILCSMELACAATVYQRKDEKGRVTLADRPCGSTAASETSKHYEGSAERGKAWESANPSPVAPQMRTVVCKSYLDAYNGLDAAWLEAAKRRDDAVQKAVIERRRHYGRK